MNFFLSLWDGYFLSSVQKGDPAFLRLGMCEKLRWNFCSLDFPRKQGQHVLPLLICPSQHPPGRKLALPAGPHPRLSARCCPTALLVSPEVEGADPWQRSETRSRPHSCLVTSLGLEPRSLSDYSVPFTRTKPWEQTSLGLNSGILPS